MLSVVISSLLVFLLRFCLAGVCLLFVFPFCEGEGSLLVLVVFINWLHSKSSLYNEVLVLSKKLVGLLDSLVLGVAARGKLN